MTNEEALEVAFLLGRHRLRLDDVTEALGKLSKFAPKLRVPLREDQLVAKWVPVLMPSNTTAPCDAALVEASIDA